MFLNSFIQCLNQIFLEKYEIWKWMLVLRGENHWFNIYCVFRWFENNQKCSQTQLSVKNHQRRLRLNCENISTIQWPMMRHSCDMSILQTCRSLVLSHIWSESQYYPRMSLTNVSWRTLMMLLLMWPIKQIQLKLITNHRIMLKWSK